MQSSTLLPSGCREITSQRLSQFWLDDEQSRSQKVCAENLSKSAASAQSRECVINSDEEARYLAAVSEPLVSIASILADTGMRPEERFRLRWDDLTWVNGRNGVLLVTRGKTVSARRVIPMTPRVRAVLESRWEGADKPQDGWVWLQERAAATSSRQACESTMVEAAKRNEKPTRPFVLYSLLHTFLTRLGRSGCDV